jgi:hypothetical protein
MRREVTCVRKSLLWQLSHLIKYISNVVRHRGGTDDSTDDINDINDIRNGLLLTALLHRPLVATELALLKVCYYLHPKLF